jgi:putative membrane protein
MKPFLARWLINAVAILLATYLIPGIEVSGPLAILAAAALLGVLNALIRPLFILLTLPINILTLGFFTLIINGLLLWMVSSLIKGFFIQGFWVAVLGALVISLFSWLINRLIK